MSVCTSFQQIILLTADSFRWMSLITFSPAASPRFQLTGTKPRAPGDFQWEGRGFNEGFGNRWMLYLLQRAPRDEPELVQINLEHYVRGTGLFPGEEQLLRDPLQRSSILRHHPHPPPAPQPPAPYFPSHQRLYSCTSFYIHANRYLLTTQMTCGSFIQQNSRLTSPRGPGPMNLECSYT